MYDGLISISPVTHLLAPEGRKRLDVVVNLVTNRVYYHITDSLGTKYIKPHLKEACKLYEEIK